MNSSPFEGVTAHVPLCGVVFIAMSNVALLEERFPFTCEVNSAWYVFPDPKPCNKMTGLVVPESKKVV